MTLPRPIKCSVGYVGNEIANLLAQQAALAINHFEIERIKYPRSYIKKKLKQDINNCWQLNWNNDDTGRHTFRFFPIVNDSFVCTNPVIVYITSGHGSFPSYLHRIKKKVNNLCNCGKIGDVDHYLFESCPLVKEFFKKPLDNLLHIWIQKILTNSVSLRKIQNIYNILNETYSFID